MVTENWKLNTFLLQCALLPGDFSIKLGGRRFKSKTLRLRVKPGELLTTASLGHVPLKSAPSRGGYGYRGVELTTWHYRSPLPVGRAAIDRYILAAGHTAANPQQRRAVREWDRQTDSKPAAAECSARMG